jgi:CP12 domain
MTQPYQSACAGYDTACETSPGGLFPPFLASLQARFEKSREFDRQRSTAEFTRLNSFGGAVEIKKWMARTAARALRISLPAFPTVFPVQMKRAPQDRRTRRGKSVQITVANYATPGTNTRSPPVHLYYPSQPARPAPHQMAFVSTPFAVSARAAVSSFAGARMVAARRARPAAVSMNLDTIQTKIQEEMKKAQEATAKYGKTSKEAALAWDVVEELEAEASHMKANQKTADPLDKYCEDSPEADEVGLAPRYLAFI